MAARTRRALMAAVAGLLAGGLAAGAFARPSKQRPPNQRPIRLRPADPLAVVRTPVTRLQAFKYGPFPYSGPAEDGRRPFYDVADGRKRRGRRTPSGEVLWEDTTFGDNRVLLHVPAGFDPRRPALMVFFFHGHGSIIERTVTADTGLLRQLAESGANAVLVAPQFAYDAADSSPGKFLRPGAFARFIDETAARLAQLMTPSGTSLRPLSGVFNKAPVMLVAFSGGYKPAAYVLTRGGAAHRIHSLVLLDALYDEEDKFAAWFARARPRSFLASLYTESTAANQTKLRNLLARRRIASTSSLPASLSRGTAAFVASGSIDRHARFVLEGPPRDPVKTILAATPGYRMKPEPPPARPAKPPTKPVSKRQRGRPAKR
ncbi:MAG: alpha/beta hydrolase [Alphaproteobacteria bacterium]|nr:alpha/beta hydrolase [Alphaproteobacteria bacterium]MCW5743411.1 alpha/beta hydrolase [Alphaproteobacteria bacterium]